VLTKQVKQMKNRKLEENLVAQGVGAGGGAQGGAGGGRSSPTNGILALEKQVAQLAGKVKVIERSPAYLKAHDSKEVQDGSYGSLHVLS